MSQRGLSLRAAVHAALGEPARAAFDVVVAELDARIRQATR